MLKYLKLRNLGPIPETDLSFGTRLNILTGDNGLGKSVLLDVAWFALTNTWPANENTKLSTGMPLLPKTDDFEFKVGISEGIEIHERSFTYLRAKGWWQGFDGYQNEQQLVVYLMADGSCAVFDPYRNEAMRDPENGPPSIPFVFSPFEVMNGLTQESGDRMCNGLIVDWAGWQKENGYPFEILKKVLAVLSPDPSNPLQPGSLTRIKIKDVRDMPTIASQLDDEIAVVHASAGMKRILTFAYLLVWTWDEHMKASKFLQRSRLKDILFLVDEVDAHLHPSWQRKIVPSILEVANALHSQVSVQLIGTTHAPLVMASLEPIFDSETDAWFDLDRVGENGHQKVQLEKREFELRGDANKWLHSKAFDLHSSRSEPAEKLLKEAAIALDTEGFDAGEAAKIYERLLDLLPADDTFFIRWDMIGRKKGWVQ